MDPVDSTLLTMTHTQAEEIAREADVAPVTLMRFLALGPDAVRPRIRRRIERALAARAKGEWTPPSGQAA